MKKDTLPLSDTDRISRKVDKVIPVLERVDFLEDVDPKDRIPRDKRALRDRKKIHLGEFRVSIDVEGTYERPSQ